MTSDSIFSPKQEGFINYIICKLHSGQKSLPSINQLSKELDVSIPCLREQIELSKNLGIVEIQPRKGISILPYQFSPAVIKSLTYSIKLDKNYFKQYSQLRMHLESSFFLEAVELLDEADTQLLYSLTQAAKKKLSSDPIQIPHMEHRNFHLGIFHRLENVYVKGLLESYWDIYESIGMDVYFDIDYLNDVWEYHESIATDLINRKFFDAFQKQTEHMKYIYKRQKDKKWGNDEQ